MGECGCGDYNAFAKFPAPGGHAYVLQLYNGCEYCDTPAGVIIEHVRKPELVDRDWESLPTIDFFKNHELAIPVVDPQQLLKAITDEVGQDVVDGMTHERILPQASSKTIAEFKKTFFTKKRRRK